MKEENQLRKQNGAAYTNVYHAARKKLKLTFVEYIVADIVSQLSHSTNKAGGWCYMSKDSMAELLDLSRMQIHRIINTLLKQKLIERDPSTTFLRSSPRWIAEVVETYHYNS